MSTDMNHLLYAAEDHFLQASEIAEFQENVGSLAQRLQVYELLRDQEARIWDAIVAKLESDFPQEDSDRLERAVSHWIAVLRYGAMAMLLHDPNFLKRRLLEWLTDIVQAHQLATLELAIFKQLQIQLKKYLSGTQWQLIQPFMMLSKTVLLDTQSEQPLATAQS